MILIADSGSTKTEWAYRHDKEVRIVTTPGFNPYFVDAAFIEQSLVKDLLPYINLNDVSDIYFYGAGCSTPEKQALVHDAISSLFCDAYIEVEHDLMGAARALFGKKKGIACILGTGSNSCYYDGKEILENVTSLGYIFGDEGSGVHIGKKLLEDFLRGNMPDEIKQNFDNTYKLNVFNILDSIYKKSRPNTFIAGFCRFAGANIHHPYIQSIVKNSLMDFFNYQLKKYSVFGNVPLGCVGSVAYQFEKEFRDIACEFGLKELSIHSSPTELLLKFHLDINH